MRLSKINRGKNKMKKYTKEELKEILRLHELEGCADLSYATLIGSDLSCADLSGADLSGADLSGANLSCANLSGANLCGANLCQADLSCADLSGADLSGANLSCANLRDTNLCYANLSGAELRFANLRHAGLRDANLSGANLSGANLSGANLSGANLSCANLSGVIGNMAEVKSLHLDTYNICYTCNMLTIGCQSHSIAEWAGFSDEEISSMDGKKALAFWGKYKKVIFDIIELSPATSPKEK
jgi:Pentapeptide repeats (8 copies)